MMGYKFYFPLTFRIWSASLLWIFVGVVCFEWTIWVITLRFSYFIWYEFASLVLSSTTLNWIRWRSLIVMMLWYFKFGCVHSTTIVRTAFDTLMRWYGWYVDNFDTLMSTTAAWKVRIPSIRDCMVLFQFYIFNFLIPPWFATHFTHYPSLLWFARDGDNKMLRSFEILWVNKRWQQDATTFRDCCVEELDSLQMV